MWLNDILNTNEKGNPSDLSDLRKTEVGQNNLSQAIENTALSDLSDLKTCKCETDTITEHNFCPLQKLLSDDIGIGDVDPENGILLATGFSCSDTLRHTIELWTLGHFEALLVALEETRPIARKVKCISLNAYELPLN